MSAGPGGEAVPPVFAGAPPTVSVIVVAWRSPVLRECLAAIAAIAAARGSVTAETIVVLNGTDRAADVPPGTTTVSSAVNLGFGGAANAGAEHATGEYLVFLHDDAIVSDGWLDALVGAATFGGPDPLSNPSAPRVGAVGSALAPPGQAHGAVTADAEPVTDVAGCGLLIPRETFRELGGFDDRFFPGYGEDLDLCARLTGRGLSVLHQPGSRITLHDHCGLDDGLRHFLHWRMGALLAAPAPTAVPTAVPTRAVAPAPTAVPTTPAAPPTQPYRPEGGRRRLAVFTIVKDEAVNLPVWLRHYRRHIDPADTFVLDHDSRDGSTDDLRPVNVVPVHLTTSFDHTWLRSTVEAFQAFLLHSYDTVIFAEADELLLPDPELHSCLGDYVDAMPAPSARATGYNVVHHDGEQPWVPAAPLGQQRRWWHRAPRYDKTLVTRTPLRYEVGFHEQSSIVTPADPGLLLLHLHRVDRDACLARHTAHAARRWSATDLENALGAQNRVVEREEFDRWFLAGEDLGDPVRAPIPQRIRAAL